MLKQKLLLLVYNKDVVCIIDQNGYPTCKTIESPRRRVYSLKNLPSHDPYIPRPYSVFYKCSKMHCAHVTLHSITQLASPKLILKSCFIKSKQDYECEMIRYNYLKNIDKLVFLSNAIPNKTFYLVDCLIYADGVRVCHKKDNINSHADLVDTGTIVRPNEPNILSQDEFICEENKYKKINCDLNPYIPFHVGLEPKKIINTEQKVLLKTGNSLISLKYNCRDTWCGYSGHLSPTRRALITMRRYEPAGSKVYRCFYANKQQICKELYGNDRNVYNGRAWLNT